MQKIWHTFWQNTLPDLLKEIYDVFFLLFKLTLPVIIIVKVLEELGAIPYISALLEPLMLLVGLPENMGIVWTTTMITNVYGGMIIFFQMANDQTLTVAQVTVLGSMMLIAHSLPIEIRIVQQAGVRLAVALALRIVSALILGMILHHIYSWGNWLQQPVELLWQPPAHTDQGLLAWSISQLKSFAMIFVIIAVLLSLLRLLRWLHIERLMIWLLKPVLKILGISPKATSLTIIGITLGLSFGGGLLIREARSGNIDPQDCFSALCLLGLCHSIIEDTLLIMTLGADLSGILWARLAFSLIFIAIMTRLLKICSEPFKHRYLMHNVVVPTTTPGDTRAR